MMKDLGQPIVIENQVGAGGVVAVQRFVHATPDGYTILLSGSGPMVLAPLLYSNITYKPLDDFEHVYLAVTAPGIVAISSSIPAKTLQQFIDLVKAAPDKFNYASSGIGTPTHLAGKLFESIIGKELLHVPYRGAPEAATGVATGQASMYTGTLPAVGPLAQSGRLTLLAQMAPLRLAAAANIPTSKEEGYPDFTIPTWFGYFVPRGTPKAVTEKLRTAAAKALKDSTVRGTFDSAGLLIIGEDAEQFSQTHRAEFARWGNLIREMKLQVQ